MFNHSYYAQCFAALLAQLRGLGKSNVAIVMDNASYHKRLPEDTPKGNWSKVQLLEACTWYGVETSANEYKSQIWQKLRAYIKKHVHPVIVAMATEQGHTGIVGRAYTVATTLADFRVRLNAAFDSLPSYAV
ncbi:hypothetical protein ACHHYP_05306 [Achlya hypogyna]|uniref:Tc1-like transposase DDE domain-containing protein n=1 Tax=Achlya hypogyna TaxID=1202772 RepID=A0A1V9YY19_ACHHY|nr:hypothetical protein ACHHYP_05306 [Achlya hypogyna]